MKLKTLVFTALVALPTAGLAAPPAAKLYKNPNCGCCDEYAEYLERNGYEVELINSTDMAAVKAEHDIPEALYGCHTMTLGSYVFEGLVPVDSVDRVLEERPFIRGLSLPGMPRGAPGMSGPKNGPLTVYSMGLGSNGKSSVYATY